MLYKREQYRVGHLTARAKPGRPEGTAVKGLQILFPESRRKSYFYVPINYDPDKPVPLAIMLHGSGGNAKQGLPLLREFADQWNLLLLAPASQDYTWDIIAGNSYGKDVIFLDEALEYLFERYVIDTRHLAIGGFSDGASYALSVGISNGDLFTHIIAFFPGFYYTVVERGRPGIFISHGISDPVLPINPCSRRIVPQLHRKGLTVVYQEFEDGHVIPPTVAQTAVKWFVMNE